MFVLAASVTVGSGTDGTDAGDAIAFLTLSGTGITTYKLPVSVSVVVTSRTIVPLRRSLIFPAYHTSTLFSGLFQSA